MAKAQTLQDIFPPPRPRRLDRAEIERLSALDPTSPMGRGQLRAMSQRSTDPDDPARPLLDALLAIPAAGPTQAPYANPARVRVPRADGEKRPLTPADIEWLRRLPSDPAAVAAEDAATLATMVHHAASGADLRLLVSHFEPIWAHHDVQEQLQQRRRLLAEAQAAAGVRTRHVEQAAIDALTATVQEQFPDLRENEARARATEQLREQWAAIDRSRQAQIEEASSTEAPAPRPMPGLERLSPLAASNEKAQREREAVMASPFARLG